MVADRSVLVVGEFTIEEDVEFLQRLGAVGVRLLVRRRVIAHRQ
jgi:hypothetical protein